MAISETPRDICFYTTFLNNQRQGNQGNQLTTAKGLIKSALSALIRKKKRARVLPMKKGVDNFGGQTLVSYSGCETKNTRK